MDVLVRPKGIATQEALAPSGRANIPQYVNQTPLRRSRMIQFGTAEIRLAKSSAGYERKPEPFAELPRSWFGRMDGGRFQLVPGCHVCRSPF
jgi:hypothetical protein